MPQPVTVAGEFRQLTREQMEHALAGSPKTTPQRMKALGL